MLGATGDVCEQSTTDDLFILGASVDLVASELSLPGAIDVLLVVGGTDGLCRQVLSLMALFFGSRCDLLVEISSYVSLLSVNSS